MIYKSIEYDILKAFLIYTSFTNLFQIYWFFKSNKFFKSIEYVVGFGEALALLVAVLCVSAKACVVTFQMVEKLRFSTIWKVTT